MVIVAGMTEPTAYLNGEWIPFSEARLSVADFGVVQAATVTEMIRTFRHRPFRVVEHLSRLRQSLDMTGIAEPAIVNELPPIIEQVVRENSAQIDLSDDLGISLFVTAGINSMYARGATIPDESPTVCVHSFPLAFGRWAEKYEGGATLVTPAVRAIPRTTIDPHIKHRSRLHWFLADREARQTAPGATALLLDGDGHLTETSSGNILLFDGEVIRTPRAECVLDGISQNLVLELAATFGVAHRAENLDVADLLEAQEAFLSSTTYCLQPVTNVNGEPIGSGAPGPFYRRLIDAWSHMVDVDIIRQAQERTSERTQGHSKFHLGEDRPGQAQCQPEASARKRT